MSNAVTEVEMISWLMSKYLPTSLEILRLMYSNDIWFICIHHKNKITKILNLESFFCFVYIVQNCILKCAWQQHKICLLHEVLNQRGGMEEICGLWLHKKRPEIFNFICNESKTCESFTFWTKLPKKFYRPLKNPYWSTTCVHIFLAIRCIW